MKLIDKYNVPGPRYTSYPTVPYWDNDPSEADWKEHVSSAFSAYNISDGISVYIHLPYCESLCTFCGCTTRITVNHGVEEPYIEALLKEWDLYLELFDGKPQIKELHLGGGTPTFFSPTHLKKLFKGIIGKSELHPSAELGFEANPKTTSHAHLKVMADLGFKRLSLGIQDFDPVVQKTINRVQSFSQVKQVTDWARDLGYDSINYDLVYGLPFQTQKSIENTVDLVSLLRPDRIAFYSYAHVPWVKPGQRSFTDKDLPEGTEKHSMYVKGKRLLTEAGYIEIGMDHFALPEDHLSVAFRARKMHRNFMGYTTQTSKLMIGLGVSAISDTWSSFGQNVKVVEEYIRSIDEGTIPIFRGHMLSEEDMEIRKIILELMCSFKSSISSEASRSLSTNLETLKEMEKDSLVRINDRGVTVTKKGRAFVRNICMAFDQRLIANKPETQIFSMTV
ncbi:MAG: oxygen-independent coproporphyrinogen III oxidase [Flavobacteriales bacterium]|jgi:oxygen-independent coproporphyrinogen III oxidase|nr:oxygen-independent coproporphyrinogen III oxidase [Flavobacteriales bacterium]MBT3963142.1 oxygen-independent coproporphyrinogen III oxidase [Flavobacteriales bacterium]MBT4931511.1 oxygen-independent coproporphyrinogen III oxidase [Flavobacteriales bacterium]MBT5131623.1 oxygen-independent coproporphyrinogen III oxidase [Flavobacteriales bacterium]MBT5977439.1 oxygen-independent coproporphyrinogen III oxidase [Flavobacteriales bacterium]